MTDEYMDGLIHYFKEQVGNAIRNNNKNIINKIMLPENYPKLTREQKEECMLEVTLAFLQVKHGPIVENFLNYLIFEYRINKEIYLKVSQIQKNELIENLFHKRKLHEELNKDLHLSSKINRKTKI